MTPGTVLTSVLLGIATCGALLFTTAASPSDIGQIDVGRISDAHGDFQPQTVPRIAVAWR